jgi:hypothetical protein
MWESLTAIRYFSALCVVLALLGCTRSPDFAERTLPSGRTIKLMSIGTMLSGDGPALMLRYRTDLAVDNIPALQQEVDDIWTVFQIDAEKAKVNTAIISANDAPKSTGLISSTSRGYNFVYRKSPDGQWSRLKNKNESELSER